MTIIPENLASKGMLADPGDHFIGRYEVELKFRVPGLAAVRGALDRQEAKPFAIGNVETDIFLDHNDGRLAAAGRTHVLRRMLPSDRVLWIVKGPRRDACLAMDLPNYDKAVVMLGALGFEEQARLTKCRDIYLLEDCHVTLDVVEGQGHFTEIAAMTDDQAVLPDLRSRIERRASELGLSNMERIDKSYIAMLRDKEGVR